LRYRKTFILLTILIVFITSRAFVAEAGTATDSSDWKLRKDKNGIRVWTRDHKEEGILEYLSKITIETNLETLIDIIQDVDKYPDWTENCETASIKEVLSDSSRIEYMTTKVPWPLEDRDVAMEFVVVKNTDTYFQANLTSVPEAVPLSDDYLRIEISQGSWIFKKIDDNRVEVIHQFMSDPGGNIPKWIVNMFIVSGPYKTLENLKEISAVGENK
jgi:ribosome-associated toxin RatA of RatAB toxin-antitoxin module